MVTSGGDVQSNPRGGLGQHLGVAGGSRATVSSGQVTVTAPVKPAYRPSVEDAQLMSTIAVQGNTMNKLLDAVNILSDKVLAIPAQVSPQVEQVQPVGQVQHVGQVTQQPLHEEYAYDGNISDCFFVLSG